eukprot:comp15583_c0_seq1/m.12686 comp15583_c0_seq1/g.12686  ORF comp15583_c0_seq1/g.12686 comp15583_c0_seq1/m.12686 type:complete len:255 (-) comp15583_c0_seq1:222-986(-)
MSSHPCQCPHCGFSFFCSGGALNYASYQPGAAAVHTMQSQQHAVHDPQRQEFEDHYANRAGKRARLDGSVVAAAVAGLGTGQRADQNPMGFDSRALAIGRPQPPNPAQIVPVDPNENLKPLRVDEDQDVDIGRYVCPVEGCGYCSDYASNVKRHILLHTGERPHRCPHPGCNATFTQKGSLKAHETKHTGNKPHKCTVENCRAAFAASKDLKIHMRTHTGERPCVCKYEGCGEAYSDPSALRKHMQRRHQNQPM